MAVAGQLSVEGVEELVVTEGEDGSLVLGTEFRGEAIEPAEVEDDLLSVAVIPTEGV